HTRCLSDWSSDVCSSDLKSQIQNTGHWHQHGFGWCSWKGFILLDAFSRRMQAGDVALYLDADTFPIAPFGQLFEACAREGGVFQIGRASCRERVEISGGD